LILIARTGAGGEARISLVGAKQGRNVDGKIGVDGIDVALRGVVSAHTETSAVVRDRDAPDVSIRQATSRGVGGAGTEIAGADSVDVRQILVAFVRAVVDIFVL